MSSKPEYNPSLCQMHQFNSDNPATWRVAVEWCSTPRQVTALTGRSAHVNPRECLTTVLALEKQRTLGDAAILADRQCRLKLSVIHEARRFCRSQLVLCVVQLAPYKCQLLLRRTQLVLERLELAARQTQVAPAA